MAGYVGGVHRHVDRERFASLSRALPDVRFVLVGPAQTDVDALRRLPNVHLLGPRPHPDVPRYIKGFDVGLVPYALNDYTSHVYPTKLNEYLAMGVPVVATDLPEVRRFAAEHPGVVHVAATASAFADAVGAALASPDTARARRIAAARGNGWDERIERMSKLMDQALAARRAAQPTWDVTLRRVYRRARRRALATLLAVLSLYVVVFESPVPWMVAAPLRVSEPARAADAIGVFEGGVGESGRAGSGYQERVKHAVELYLAGHAPRIVFSSGLRVRVPRGRGHA